MRPGGRAGLASPPHWTEWEWDDIRQLLRRTLVDYRGRILREQFGQRRDVPRGGETELERVRNDEQTTADAPRPNYTSAVRWGPPQPLDVASENESSNWPGGTPASDFCATYVSQDASRGGRVPHEYGGSYYGTPRPTFMTPSGQQQPHLSSDTILSFPHSQMLNRPQAPSGFPLTGLPAIRNNLGPSTLNFDANYRQPNISNESAMSRPGNRPGQPHTFYESNSHLDSRSPPSNLDYGSSSQQQQQVPSLEFVDNRSPFSRQRDMLDSGPESQQTGLTTERYYFPAPGGHSFEEWTLEGPFSWGQTDSYYMSITKPENWFKPGRIFNTNWTKGGEPSNGERIFVVMREGLRCSECCLLQPYSLVSFRHGNDSSMYAVIFELGKRPQLFNGESHLKRFPVIIEKPTETIDPTLRLDFSTIYSIDHSAEVRNVGRIDRDYLKELKSTAFKAVGEKHLGKTDLEEFQMDDKPTVGNSRREVSSGQLISVDVRSEKPNFEEVQESMMPTAKTGLEMVKGKITSLESKSRRNTYEESRNSPQSQIREPIRSEGLPIRRDDTRTKRKTRTGDSLDESFEVRPFKDFKKGTMLITLWSEPLGYGTSATYSGEFEGTTPSKFGEFAYNSVRRFVVVSREEGHSLCIPILTYGGRGTLKPGVKADHHAVIYSTKTAPMLLGGEEPLIKDPVRVEMFDKNQGLHPSSRLNYRKIYTLEHNIKVRIVGRIHKDSETVFFSEVKRIFDNVEEE